MTLFRQGGTFRQTGLEMTLFRQGGGDIQTDRVRDDIVQTGGGGGGHSDR